MSDPIEFPVPKPLPDLSNECSSLEEAMRLHPEGGSYIPPPTYTAADLERARTQAEAAAYRRCATRMHAGDDVYTYPSFAIEFEQWATEAEHSASQEGKS